MTRLSAILSLLSILLVGCGMSEKERQNIAAVTCSVMGETRKMDAAIRVREINAARKKLGEPPYLGGDDGIKESFKSGLCEKLVLNDPTYDSTLEELQRIAAEERRQIEEAFRIAREKIEEEKRIAREERERIAREEREERERIAREKERVPRQKWRAALEADLQDASLEFISASYDDQNVRLEINYTCQPIYGFRRTTVVVLKNNLGTLTQRDPVGACGYKSRQQDVYYSFTGIEDDLEDALYGTSDPTKFIKEIYVLIEGVYSVSPKDRMRRLNPRAYPPLSKDSLLQEPIRINVKM